MHADDDDVIRAPSAMTETRNRGPREIERSTGLLAGHLANLRLPFPFRKFPKVNDGHVQRIRDAIRCSGSPSSAVKVVRSISCRRTISPMTLCNRPRFGAPLIRVAVVSQ